ncbi:hypothetical protein BDF20DRAFT_939492 [Mycotypha africana]|uniref:uncharacterized protein n=1 Tax=Mycotypha africana TaxID=64632 RepID=UPI002301C678|nr:uncharacterized protein BDF20DRAFT_939492 [Mycotypha africana]KAI8979279.1 hypothetical protein BDF20DRAFT_939492 [Mycotypha africana]
MSDLEGDQASDNEESYNFEQNEKTKDTNEENQDNNNTQQAVETTPSEISTITKLPSFKKKRRDIDEEESARLAEVRRELLELKNSTSTRGENDAADEPTEDEIIVDPQQAVRDEVAETFERALKAGKKKRRRQEGEDLDNNLDEELTNLRERMKTAAEEDAMSNEQRKAALAKLKMLGEVTNMLTNKHLQDSVLDNGLLESIRLWLEPLPDRSLPSLDIQVEMLDILDKLPISADHLRESGVGKIVYFYTKAKQVETPIRRKADNLVAKWSRLIIKRSENYRDRRPALQEYTQEPTSRQRKRFRRPSGEAGDESYCSETRHFVRVPQAVAADYDIAPQSTVRADKSRTPKADSTFRRLNNTMRSIKTGPKKVGPKVSIEGKGMNF